MFLGEPRMLSDLLICFIKFLFILILVPKVSIELKEFGVLKLFALAVKIVK